MKNVKNYKWYFIGGIIIGLLLFFDLMSKYLVQNMDLNDMGEVVVIPHFFSISYAKNYGAAFSSFDGYGIFLICFAIVFLVAFTYYLFRFKPKGAWWTIGYVLVTAGTLGNLVDRIFFGYVRDFIKISFFPPIFNLADSFLVVGMICLFVYILFFSHKEKNGDGEDKTTTSWL